MTDEYIVVVSRDKNLVKTIQNATKMDVIHATNHDTAREKTYRRKIVIIDPDTVQTTQTELSTWYDNAHYLIVILENHDDAFIEQNQAFISDVWFNPVNLVLIEKRLSSIQNIFDLKRFTRDRIRFFGAETRNPLASVKGYAEILLTKDKLAGELTDQQLNFIGVIRNQGVRIRRLFDDMLDDVSIEADLYYQDITTISVSKIFDKLKAPEFDDKLHYIESYPNYVLKLPQDLPNIFADEHRLLYVFERTLLNARYSSKPSVISAIFDELFVHFLVTNFDKDSYSIDLENVENFFFHNEFTATKIIKHVIKTHSGEMWLEQNGDSSTFHFTIPIAKESDE